MEPLTDEGVEPTPQMDPAFRDLWQAYCDEKERANAAEARVAGLERDRDTKQDWIDTLDGERTTLVRQLTAANSRALAAEAEAANLWDSRSALVDDCATAESALASARQVIDAFRAWNASWLTGVGDPDELLEVARTRLASLDDPKLATCACCAAPADNHPMPDPWDGRMDDYCNACALARCDAYPGDHALLPEPTPPESILTQLYEDRVIRDFDRDEDKDRDGAVAFTVWMKR